MRILLVAVIVFIYACSSSTAGDTKDKSTHVTNRSSSNKTLLELFTSQGCSSCPPADKLVTTLAQADTNLVVISFHVDYWDRLGWKDIFSNHEYTLRQQQYVQALHAESVYTPQAVVQGQFEMVGSNRPGILQAVKTAAEQNNEINFDAKASVDNRTVAVHYKLDKILPSHYQICGVLVENQSSTSVSRGENSGKQLAGYHVARAMKLRIADKEEDGFQFVLPDDITPGNASVIIFIQDVLTKKIEAVRQLTL